MIERRRLSIILRVSSKKWIRPFHPRFRDILHAWLRGRWRCCGRVRCCRWCWVRTPHIFPRCAILEGPAGRVISSFFPYRASCSTGPPRTSHRLCQRQVSSLQNAPRRETRLSKSSSAMRYTSYRIWPGNRHWVCHGCSLSCDARANVPQSPNPVAPYFLQVYTSYVPSSSTVSVPVHSDPSRAFIVPFVIPAGDSNSALTVVRCVPASSSVLPKLQSRTGRFRSSRERNIRYAWRVEMTASFHVMLGPYATRSLIRTASPAAARPSTRYTQQQTRPSTTLLYVPTYRTHIPIKYSVSLHWWTTERSASMLGLIK